MDRHPGQIRQVYRYYPLRMHRYAGVAARAAEAAAAQRKFWSYHDILFDHQTEWAESIDPIPLFISYAAGMGLDVQRFERDVRSERRDAVISADVEAARAANVNSTPTVFINGVRLVGPKQVEADGERLVMEALR
jgi:protein-disulfide isomerase